ncbi:methyl-accepting chemotaxis protein [Kineobactrum salinum]|uniref:HAMP domain-containing protein n=1 Tax=Kineobactrum salinum TaxID=2708301 RepID=A0A6C0TWU8_9GAMM|nr:methyl-accepting chemotaxis protein [Kineobactrum salinum]QIB64302.1 HAMP domain-containing protein [Kineobactrum salinum]
MMKFIHNLKLNVAVGVILFTFVLLIGLISGIGLLSGSEAKKALQNVDMINVGQLNEVNRGANLLNEARVTLDVAGAYVAKDQGLQAERQLAVATGLLESAEAHFARFMEAPKSPEVEERAQALNATFTELVELVREQHDSLTAGDYEDFSLLREILLPVSDELRENLTGFVEYASGAVRDEITGFETQIAMFTKLEFGALLFTAVMVVLIFLGMRAVIIRPIAVAANSLKRIAGADLTEEIVVPGKNEIGQLFAAMHDMQDSLGRIILDVRDSSNSIFVGATQISSGNSDLSSRTEQQAASLQETATSMEQLTATVQQNADNARQASGLANDASSTASRGGEVVDKVITTMHGIADSSKKIADITGMIDSIAFQTNILALNASVEAARAGEQGRGFAVVAGEVRNLAGNSADAARQIKQLIESSAVQVEQGSTLVSQAGETMRDVVTAVKRVTDIMDEISAASQEQSGGINQVSQAVTQMDEVTQQNASLVQEAAAAAASLEEQARQLEKAVAIFRVGQAEIAADRSARRSNEQQESHDKEHESDEAKAAEDHAGFGVRDNAQHEQSAKSGSRLKAVGSDDWEDF